MVSISFHEEKYTFSACHNPATGQNTDMDSHFADTVISLARFAGPCIYARLAESSDSRFYVRPC